MAPRYRVIDTSNYNFFSLLSSLHHQENSIEYKDFDYPSKSSINESIHIIKVQKSEGRTLFVVYVKHSKNKLGHFKNKKTFVYIYFLFSI